MSSEYSVSKRLLRDFTEYKTTNHRFHSGDVVEHSLWSLHHMKGILKVNKYLPIPAELQSTLLCAAFLHDIGKGGDKVTTFFDKPNHPEIGAYYLANQRYECIDGTVIDPYDIAVEFGCEENYEVVCYLVKNHWMIGSVFAEYSEKKWKWKLYYKYNLSVVNCQTDISTSDLFKCLVLLWMVDLLATRPYTEKVESLVFSNPGLLRQSQDMFVVYQVETRLPVIEEVVKTLNNPPPPITLPFETLIPYTFILNIGGKWYKQEFDEYPFVYTEKHPTEEEIKKYTKREYSSMDFFKQYKELYLKNITSPNQVPLFQGFPSVASQLSLEAQASLFAYTACGDPDFIYTFPRVLKTNLSAGIEEVKEGTLLYHGREYRECEPPNISNSRGFWAFYEKKNAIMYAVRQEESTTFPTDGNCWNVLTYKTTRPLNIINFSKREIRDKIRNDLKEFPVSANVGKPMLLSDEKANTFTDAFNYMFPKDLDDSQKFRVSSLEIDIEVAILLSQVYPQIQGWYIESPEMDPELCIFRPYSSLILISNDFLDAKRMKPILEMCMNKKVEEKKCKEMIRQAVLKNQVVCLQDSEGLIKCYLIEELLSHNIVSPHIYEFIVNEVKKGNLVVKVP